MKTHQTQADGIGKSVAVQHAKAILEARRIHAMTVRLASKPVRSESDARLPLWVLE